MAPWDLVTVGLSDPQKGGGWGTRQYALFFSGFFAEKGGDGSGQGSGGQRIDFTQEIALCRKHKPENQFSPPQIRRGANTRWFLSSGSTLAMNPDGTSTNR
jgi:hypothetical protein